MAGDLEVYSIEVVLWDVCNKLLKLFSFAAPRQHAFDLILTRYVSEGCLAKIAGNFIPH